MHGVGLMVTVRPLRLGDAGRSARIHRDELGMEFLARFGTRFLVAYHRAWIRSPAGLALAATDGDRLVGVMLATLDPAAHYRWMLRRAGPGLALRMVAASLVRPALGRELVVTRAGRYAGAIRRHLLAARTAGRGSATSSVRVDPAPAGPGRGGAGPVVGEVTHLMVTAGSRGTGAGRALLETTEAQAALAGLDELVLVTPPDLEARGFYGHLGWVEDGEMSSRSGEAFIRFRRQVPLPPDPPLRPARPV